MGKKVKYLPKTLERYKLMIRFRTSQTPSETH